jgi:dihydrolipoamide dehydrogenase
VAVIGGGPAGYAAAIKAAMLGGKVILFEKDVVGGTCLNRGCIPAKTYLKTAEYLHCIRRAPERGVVLDAAVSVDMKKARAHKDAIVKKLTSGVAFLLKSHGVRVEPGEAVLKSPQDILCGDRTFSAGSVILCGGGKPGRPPIPGIEHAAVLDSTGILSVEAVPKRLCIIGGGVIGCEIACAFAAFGSEVTIVEALPRLLPNMDADLSEAIRDALTEQGVKIHLGVTVKEIEDVAGKPAVVTENERIEADRVLLSIGRVADTSCAGALGDSIKTERGFIAVNDKLETSVSGVYAAGDAVGGVMLAHAAFKMAEAAATNAMGGDVVCSLKYTPSCVYTLPEASCAGLSEAEAKEKYGAKVAVGRFPLSANGRSVASGEGRGFVKVIIDKTYGEILGVHIVAADAAEMIAEPTALMAMEVTAHEVADGIVHAHPTYTEAFMEACADALGRSVHLPPPQG